MHLANQSEIAELLTEFITIEILEDETDVELDDNLLMDLDLDSLSMLRIVGILEAQYTIKISPIYFTIEHFKSIRTISTFVAGLLQNEAM